MGVFGLWAPGFSPMPQNDMSISISPRMYKENLAPCDLRTAKASLYPMFHTHSAGAHHIETILELLPRQGSLNVVIDNTGPELESLVPILCKVQERSVPLHVTSPNLELVEKLTSELSPRGLAISYTE